MAPKRNTIHKGDCLDVLREWPTGCVDLTVTSPPYEDCRLYAELDFKAKGQEWVDWMIPRVVEMCRVTDGLVCVNMAGRVRQFSYSPVVEWLVADMTRKHDVVCGPAPYVFQRVGIPGSGSTHYHRRDWEPVYVFARPECLPPKWSDNTAFGHLPKWAPGGEMSHRLSDGARVNQWGHPSETGGTRKVDGKIRTGTKRPSHRIHTKREANGEMREQGYNVPAIANPGNVIQLKVGGGQMGSSLAHNNEAPFPEGLPRRFIRWFCPKGGIVLDPFCGSGTTLDVAQQEGRSYIGIDDRQSQVDLSTARTAQKMLVNFNQRS